MNSEFGKESKPEKRRRESRSLFGPILLIAIGFGFLLYNLEMLPDFNWTAVFWAWPLLLIFMGVDLLVRQAGPPLGGLLSGVVAVLAVGFFAWLLLGDNSDELLTRYGASAIGGIRREQVALPIGEAQHADVSIHFAEPAASVYALEDSGQLINGSVAYQGEIDFETDSSGNKAEVKLDTHGDGATSWFAGKPSDFPTADDAWHIGLSPRLPLDLKLDVASGPADLDLSDLELKELKVDGGSGRMNLQLPAGDYRAKIDVAAGPMYLVFAEGGEQRVEIKGGSGPMVITIPATKAVRLEVKEDSGPVTALPKRYTRLSGADADESIWQTESYGIAGEPQLTLAVSMESGPLTLREE